MTAVVVRITEVVVRTAEVVVPIVDHTEVAAALMAVVVLEEEELLLNFDLKKIRITDGNQLYHSR